MAANGNGDLGSKLRGLRLAKGLKQSEVAARLAISPAYLNLIEKGHRPLPFPLLYSALGILGEDPERFMAGLGKGRVDAALRSLLDEPLLKSLELDSQSLAELSAEPRLAGTVAALFNLYKDTHSQLENAMARLAESERARTPKAGAIPEAMGFGYSPFDEVTDFLEAHHNWFPALEAAAERIRRDHGLSRQLHSEELSRMLEGEFGVKVEVAAFGRGSSVVQHLDKATGILRLSPALTEQRLKFQIAVAAGVLALEKLRFMETQAKGPFRHEETARLVKINLANYFAGALMLPYQEFFAEVQRSRYDAERLAGVFGVTYETVAHRMCNLADPKRRGVPFHFVRADVAGNISKRYSATGLRFSQGSGSCAKWALHNAFLTPSIIARQYSAFPDGETYFCFAKVVTQPLEGSLVRGTVHSIGLGTRAEDARHLAYAGGLPVWKNDPGEVQRIAVPAGTSCRFCERSDCNQRAAPSYKFAFSFDEYTKKDCFFSPILKDEVRPLGRPGSRRRG